MLFSSIGLRLFGVGLFALGAAGCMCNMAPSRVTVPSFSPNGAASAAIAEFDKDGDGFLSAEELIAVPSIGGALSRFDADGDGAVSQEEIAARIHSWLDARVGLMSFNAAKVLLDGRPLPGAVVVFEPEPLLQGAVMPARGTTDAQGSVVLEVAQEDLPADQQGLAGVMQPGLYKVRITHPQKPIPAKYNTETTLGQEVAQDVVGNEQAQYRLTSQ